MFIPITSEYADKATTILPRPTAARLLVSLSVPMNQKLIWSYKTINEKLEIAGIDKFINLFSRFEVGGIESS